MNNLRTLHIKKLPLQTYDVLILGGGINGAVSAAALAAKGVKVALIDKGDFACMTSSNSSNLAWGGIKYLESYEFGLVNKLCQSRNVLMRHYPASVKEIRFLTSIHQGFRFPTPILYLGTLLYWAMGRFFTKKPLFLSADKIKLIEPVINTKHVNGGFEYSDAYFYDNDARFVFNFIRSSLDNGCIAANYVESLTAKRVDKLWHTTAQDTLTGETFTIRSKCIINACGPLADEVNQTHQETTKHHHLFSKGIHLIVDKVTQSKKVLAFFADDGRLFFVIPMGNKTCIGTTDNQVDNPHAQVTEQDRQFILKNVNKLLDLPKPLTVDDIISERCGVRPLAVDNNQNNADWVQLSRKHAIDINHQHQYLSIFGGKLTDCLNVGDEVTEIIASFGIKLPYQNQKWYGEPSHKIKTNFMRQARLMNLDALTPKSSSESLSERFWRRYNLHAFDMLTSIQQAPEKAQLLFENAEYLTVELEYAAQHEMITTLDDFLRRRSKIAMILTPEQILSDSGLHTACEILFADQAQEKLQEYQDTLKVRCQVSSFK